MLTDALRETRSAIERSLALERSCAWQLSNWARHTLFAVYDASGYNMGAAVSYLWKLGQRRKWPRRTEAELQRIVEDAFLAADTTEFAALVDISLPSNARAVRAARAHVEEYRVYAWALAANTTVGVAPSTRDLLCERARLRGVTPSVLASRKARKWGTKFRRRWGGFYGSIPAAEYMPIAEMLRKVIWLAHTRHTAIASTHPDMNVLGRLEIALALAPYVYSH